MTIGDDHKSDKGKIVVDRVRHEEARIVAELVSRLIGSYQVWDKRSKAMRPCRAGDIALLAPTGTNCGSTSARWNSAKYRSPRKLARASTRARKFRT